MRRLEFASDMKTKKKSTLTIQLFAENKPCTVLDLCHVGKVNHVGCRNNFAKGRHRWDLKSEVPLIHLKKLLSDEFSGSRNVEALFASFFSCHKSRKQKITTIAGLSYHKA